MDLVVATKAGLYCPQGQFYIDPWRPVEHAIITHAHADHARRGHGRYLSAASGEGVLRTRLGDIALDVLEYGQSLTRHGVKVSLHPAGHVLGSAQVRLEYRGEVWVASGDYKTGADATCAPFEPVRCHTFITESTFGLPIYRWQSEQTLFDEINAWWLANTQAGRASVLFCYAFGKAQRILSGVDPSLGPIVVHGAMEALNTAYREEGVALPPTLRVTDIKDRAVLKQALVLAPPSAQASPWLRRFGEYSDAFASGWMRIRGARRRRGVDRGFVMSDHADWPGLLSAIRATEAERVFVTHGSVAVMVRYLQEQGLQACSFETEFGDEDEGQSTEEAGEDSGASPVPLAGGTA